MNRSFRKILLGVLALAAPIGAGACPCVDTVVIRVDPDQRRLVATISETSRVMVTAALWELLLTEIQPQHADWLGRWQVTFFTSADAAEPGALNVAESHVADYDRSRNQLVLWPGVADRREEVTLAIK